MERWVQHYSELYPRENVVTDEALNAIKGLPEWDELDSDPTLGELNKALDSLSSGKAPGKDTIPGKHHRSLSCMRCFVSAWEKVSITIGHERCKHRHTVQEHATLRLHCIHNWNRDVCTAFFGHNVRMDDSQILKDLPLWRFAQGKRPTGRFQLRYTYVCKGDPKALGIGINELETSASECSARRPAMKQALSGTVIPELVLPATQGAVREPPITAR